jgi:hypothetical protein
MALEFNVNIREIGGLPTSFAVSGPTDDKGIPFIIGFRGDPSLAPTTTITDTYDVNFELNGSLDTTVNSNGIIAIDAAASDTVGEFADKVNASTTGWYCIIVDAARDSVLCSGVGGTAYVSLTNLDSDVTYPPGTVRGPVWDLSDTEKVIFSFGGESATAFSGDARMSARTMPPIERDWSGEDLFPIYNGGDMQGILESITAQVGDGPGTGSATLTVYSAKQSDTFATATVIPLSVSPSFTNDTERTISDKLFSQIGERLLVVFDGSGSGAAVDVLAVSATGYVATRPQIATTATQ